VVAPSSLEAPGVDKDPFREARAYHFSVYLMVAMPYLLLGGVGFLIWRAVKQKERADQIAGPAQADEGGRDSWHNPSRADDS
jgi:hypothetical protein